MPRNNRNEISKNLPPKTSGGHGHGIRNILNSEPSGKEKAAIFLITLGHEVAASVLQHLKEDEVMALTYEMTRAENVTSAQQDAVLREFNELMMAQSYLETAGPEYTLAVLTQAFGREKAEEIMAQVQRALKTPPFDFLRRVDSQHLLNFIQSEHPQTIALILCYLDTTKASYILSNLPMVIQADVARRIAVMERVLPETVRDVEASLKRKFENLRPENFTTPGGVDAAVDVLNLVDRASEKTIIEALEEDHPELAEEIKSKMVVIDDLLLMDAGSVQKVLREVDVKDLALALKGLGHDIREKVFSAMSRRASKMLVDEIEFLGPVRKRDIEDSQQRIVNVIRRLEEQGDGIIIARGPEDEVVY